jgi:hypothetical protein
LKISPGCCWAKIGYLEKGFITRQIEKLQCYRGEIDRLIADGGSNDGASTQSDEPGPRCVEHALEAAELSEDDLLEIRVSRVG